MNRRTGGSRSTERDAGTYSIEAILVVTLVLTVVLGTFQLALWATARAVARDAANSAVIAATVRDAAQDKAGLEAEKRLGRTGPALLRNHTVDVTTTSTEVRVTVSGDVVSLIPGIPVHVNVTSTGPVERWTNPG